MQNDKNELSLVVKLNIAVLVIVFIITTSIGIVYLHDTYMMKTATQYITNNEFDKATEYSAKTWIPGDGEFIDKLISNKQSINKAAEYVNDHKYKEAYIALKGVPKSMDKVQDLMFRIMRHISYEDYLAVSSQ